MIADLSYALTAYGWLYLLAALVLWLLIAFAVGVVCGRAVRLGGRPYDWQHEAMEDIARMRQERAVSNGLYRPSGRVEISTRAAPTRGSR